MHFGNQHRVRVEALQTAAPKHDGDIANPPVTSGATQSIGDDAFCAQMTLCASATGIVMARKPPFCIDTFDLRAKTAGGEYQLFT